MSRKQTLCYPEDCTNKNCKKLKNTSIQSRDEEESKYKHSIPIYKEPTNVTKGTQLKKSYLVNKSTVEKSTSTNQTLQESHEESENSKDARKLERELSLFSLHSTPSQDYIGGNGNEDVQFAGLIDTNELISIEEKCSSSCAQLKKRAEINKKFKDLQNFSRKLSLRRNEDSVNNDCKVGKPLRQITITPDQTNMINATLTEPRESRNESRLKSEEVQREGFFGRTKLEKCSFSKHVRDDLGNAHPKSMNQDFNEGEESENELVVKCPGKAGPSDCMNYDKREDIAIHSSNTEKKSKSWFRFRKSAKSISKDKSNHPELPQSCGQIEQRVGEYDETGLTYQDFFNDMNVSNKLIQENTERLPKQSKAKRSSTEDTEYRLKPSTPFSENKCIATSCKSFHLKEEREELLSVVSLSSDDNSDSLLYNSDDNLINIRRMENLLIRIEIDLKKLWDFFRTACFRIFLGPSLDETALLSWEFTNHILRRRGNEWAEINHTNT